MLKWYKQLYIGDNAKKKKKEWIRKINMGAGVVDVYLITLAVNPENQLEIFSANELKQKARRRNCPLIIGLCKGYEGKTGAAGLGGNRYSQGKRVAGKSDEREAAGDMTWESYI